MKGFFITGTDTGIGKTVLAGWLLAFMRSRGIDAVPMKPVQTGCRIHGGRHIAPDLDFCLRAAKLVPDDRERARMCPYGFMPACSPHLAARLGKRTIRLPRILKSFHELAGSHDAVIVEGAGGVLVPLNSRYTMRDLIQRMGCPVLIAARPGLGTLNHTLLTVNELKRSRCPVAGIVLVESTPPLRDAVELDNRKTLAARSGVPVLGRLKYRKKFSPAQVLKLAENELRTNMLDLM